MKACCWRSLLSVGFSWSGSFCLLLPALSTPCVFHCSTAPWFCLSISACICFWWLGSECVIASASRCSVPVDQEVLQTWKQTVECLVCLRFMENARKFLKCACEHIFILAWLIRMPLAGSCPNRGCHLIKSIICWLNLLELRRKRSVHTLSRPVCLSVSFIHPLIHPPVFRGRKSEVENSWLIQANH